MKTIGLIINDRRDENYQYTKKVIDLLKNNGFDAYLHQEASVDLGIEVIKDDRFFERCDALLTLGGDGTLLRVAEKAAIYQKPILGINLGHLGYLAQLDNQDIDLLPKLLKQDGSFVSRSMLKIDVIEQDGKICSYYALNEIALGRQIITNMLHASLYSNDEFVYNFRCDGLIFATPTGSTAYSMSSGGPIADTNLQDIIIFTPICEHSLFSKSMIFSAEDTLSCVVTKSPENSFLVIDGKTVSSMENIKKIVIKKSEFDLPLFKIGENRFYKVLNNKFSDGGNK